VSGDLIVFVANKGGIPSLIAFKPGANEPRVIIAPPMNDSWMAPESDVTINVAVFNFEITDKFNMPNSLGEGHLIYYNNVEAPTTPGKPALTSPGTYAISTSTSYTWHGLPMIPEGGYGFLFSWLTRITPLWRRQRWTLSL
jgi:hypothetical protein